MARDREAASHLASEVDASSASGSELASIPSFATLVNKELVVPSMTSNYVAVERHFFHKCIEPALQHVPVNESWYLKQYPDVASAVERGAVKSAHDHYIRFGYFEHRMPFAILVDETWYLKEYEDVRRAVADGVFESGQAHFMMAGFREGRLPHSGFSLTSRVNGA